MDLKPTVTSGGMFQTDFQPTVAPGGIFHTHKAKYSPETAAFLKELIRESKLSIFQRQQLNESIKKGDPLPLPPPKTSRRRQPPPEPEEDIKYIQIPRRRKQDIISQSGAYERDQFVPSYQTPNHDVEKKRLQDMMAFGKVIQPTKSKQEIKEKLERKQNKNKEEEINREKLFLHTLEEIKERNEFLKQMQSLGKDKDYKNIIEQQIWEKMRFLEAIDKELFDTMKKYVSNNTEIATLKG